MLKHNPFTLKLWEIQLSWSTSNLFHCYKYTNYLHDEYFCSSFSPHSFYKKKVLFLFSFFILLYFPFVKMSTLNSSCLACPLNLNLFLTLFVLFLTTIDSCYSRKSIQNIAIHLYIGQFPILFSFYLLQLLFLSEYPV